ncbi:MAG: GNAT family N-acetyltransferase [Lachnospiraceae bacterium]|nr:GNAT family N-acetyltransferase [Lachnospiraceae bacterium]
MEIIRITDKNYESFVSFMDTESVARITVHKNVIAMGAVEDNRACGIIVVGFRENMAVIHDLYVHSAHRRKGIATELLIAAAELAEDFETDGYDVTFVENLEADNGLKPFFEACEFQLEKLEAQGCYAFSLRDIRQHGTLKAQKSERVKSYSELSKMERNSLLEEPLSYMQEFMMKEDIEPDVSCFLTENEKIDACCVFIRQNDELSLAWLRGSAKNQMSIIMLFQYAIHELLQKYPEDTRIMLPVVSDHGERLSLKLLEDALTQTEIVWNAKLPFFEE